MKSIKEYYSNGKLKCTGYMNDYLQVGRWKFYFGNGLVFSEGEFDKNGKPIGTWCEYYDSGLKKYEAISPGGNSFSFDDDNLKLINFWTKEGQQIIVNGQGRLILYFGNGNIQHVSFWAKGFKDGTLQEFYQNGRLYKEYVYLNGIRSGSSKVFHENGKLYSEIYYSEGKPCGKSSFWYDDGHIEEEGEYKDDDYIILNFWSEDKKQTLVNGQGFKVRKYGATDGDIYEQHFENGKMTHEKKIAGIIYERFTPFENPETNI